MTTINTTNGKSLEVTDEQAASFRRVREQLGDLRYVDTYYDYLCDCLMVIYHDITIGIEPDGYAHS